MWPLQNEQHHVPHAPTLPLTARSMYWVISSFHFIYPEDGNCNEHQNIETVSTGDTTKPQKPKLHIRGQENLRMIQIFLFITDKTVRQKSLDS
jgi:hypothetical protein